MRFTIFKRRRGFDDRPKISLLIPFRSNDPQRRRVLRWILEYWRNELPDAEIIVASSHGEPFGKMEAFNNAAAVSTGRVLVLIDADAYIDGQVIENCATTILENIDNRVWMVPYRKLYRLDQFATEQILDSDPSDPFVPPTPLPSWWIEGDPSIIPYGRRYGAMIMMIPREAYELLGWFDHRFRGWGGEDIALLRTLDTLWGKHKSYNANLYHLYHSKIGTNYLTRKWDNQEKPNANSQINREYNKASRRPGLMRKVLDAGKPDKGLRQKVKETVVPPAKVVRKGKA